MAKRVTIVARNGAIWQQQGILMVCGPSASLICLSLHLVQLPCRLTADQDSLQGRQSGKPGPNVARY
jgi:hypothetical protein